MKDNKFDEDMKASLYECAAFIKAEAKLISGETGNRAKVEAEFITLDLMSLLFLRQLYQVSTSAKKFNKKVLIAHILERAEKMQACTDEIIGELR